MKTLSDLRRRSSSYASTGFVKQSSEMEVDKKYCEFELAIKLNDVKMVRNRRFC